MDERVPCDWPKDIVEKDEYSIRINYGTEYNTIGNQSKQLYYFEIIDQGIGMTIDQIKKYFLQIGNDYTYLLYRFVKYNRYKEQWEAVNDDLAAQDLIRQRMTDWDKMSGNIWETHGFDPYNKNTWSYAINYGVGNIGDDIEFDKVSIRVSKRDWNILEKKSDEDYRVKWLRKYFKSNCE